MQITYNGHKTNLLWNKIADVVYWSYQIHLLTVSYFLFYPPPLYPCAVCRFVAVDFEELSVVFSQIQKTNGMFAKGKNAFKWIMFAYKRQFEMLKITNIVIGNLFSNEEKSNNKIAHFCIQWLIIFLGDSFIHFFIVFPFISFSTETHLILHSENAALKYVCCIFRSSSSKPYTPHTTRPICYWKGRLLVWMGFCGWKRRKENIFCMFY